MLSNLLSPTLRKDGVPLWPSSLWGPPAWQQVSLGTGDFQMMCSVGGVILEQGKKLFFIFLAKIRGSGRGVVGKEGAKAKEKEKERERRKRI